jgi:N-acetylglutamate synthase/N-acetylornithine aminotransferase
VEFDPEQATIWFAGVRAYARGRVLDFDEQDAHQRLLAKHVPIVFDLGVVARGKGKRENGKGGTRHSPLATRHSAVIWTCDFTAQYVDINASYRT